MFAGQEEDFLSNIVHLFNVGSMLGQRRRRWPSTDGFAQVAANGRQSSTRLQPETGLSII